ncbi:hypothetical protein SAPIO_CDS8730 [Scedosporium apiospermum]|uniref:Major facilitator superfamily (MFS) profile domain-containing protein n=1 Tax=Pseudallescheria apiosperma TaxID=563466 RepID=A0A084FYU3_PSEDA|nr:uncharacterized protein SAPIO_CDS8730 [Scedosporium apiospermum]KEZ40255.1 hypothetical protein SAPIO_CDS8730 [Scedosporium apiospermum]
MSTALAGFCMLGFLSACQSLYYTIPSEVLQRRHRALGQAVVNISSGLGGVTGILVGGALLRNGNAENYRYYWYMCIAIGALGLAGAYFGYNPPLRELQSSLTLPQKLQRIDWIGTALFSSGLTLFCIALQWSYNPYSWTNSHVLAPFVSGLVLIACFIVYEWLIKKDGIFDHRLFTDWNFTIAILAVFVEGLAFFAVNSYFVAEVSMVNRTDFFDSATRFVLFFVTSAILAPIAAYYTTVTKQAREPLVAGFICLALATSLLAGTIKSDSSPSLFWGYIVLAGAGMGAILTNLPVVAQMATPAEMISVTTGILMSSRSLGGVVGLAINNALLNAALVKNLSRKVAAAVMPLGFPATGLAQLIPALESGNQQVIAQVAGVTPEIAAAGGLAVLDSYVLAFRHAWIAAASFSGLGVIVVLFLRNPKSAFNKHIDAPAEEELIILQEEIEGRLHEEIVSNEKKA